MKMRIMLLALLSVGCVSAATTVPQVKTFDFVPNNIRHLTFTKFDTSLGTLTGVTITTNITKYGGSLYVDNESESPAEGNISQSVTINLSSATVTLLKVGGTIGANIEAISTYYAICAANDEPLAERDGVQTTGLDYDGTSFGPQSTTRTENVRDLFLSEYEGSGTYTIDLSALQGFNTEAFGGAAVAISPASVMGDVTITYTYDAIPEPAVALLGGLGLLSLLRRRR